MAEKSGFFNARKTEEGTYDREYDAEQFAEYFANFVSNGVYVNPTNQLKVVFNGSSSKPFVVVVRKGKAYIDGYWYELTEDMEVTIPANTKPYVIKDVICCTLDKTERKVSIILKEDVTSDMPVNNNTQHDLVLSTILVHPNVSKLNAEDITDKRPDKTYCGFVTGLVDQIDTTELFQQYDEAFKTWFNEIKDQLSTDAAGNLQKQIGLLNNLKTIVKDSIVNAINSLYDSIIGKTLKTLDEVKSNTEQGYYVDALVIDELNSKIESAGTVKNLAAHSSANFVATGVINLDDYKYFILQCCDAAGTRVLASVNIFKDQIKYGSAYEHQAVFAGEVSNYQAACYFGTDGKIYTKGKTQYCSVRLYGVIA